MTVNIFKVLIIIFLATSFFAVPLVVKYHIYKPLVKHVVQGDVVMLERPVSSVWCQGVQFTSVKQFIAHIYNSQPRVDETQRVRMFSTHRILLPNGAHEFWGMHLLKGSRLRLSSCASLIGSGVSVVKGHSGLSRCLEEYKLSEKEKDVSGEDSQSESESDEGTSSISSSQGAVLNETLYICKNSLHHVEIPHSYRCTQLIQEFRPIETLSVDINETNYYYFVFSSTSYLEIVPNELFIQWIVDRTHYDYSSSSGSCSQVTDCDLAVGFGKDHWVDVQIQSTNTTLSSEELHVQCKLREWLFFFFYASFLLIIFFSAFQ